MGTIWTVGYEGRTWFELIELVASADIELVADVRIRPQSRKPGLSKTQLAAELGHAGIAYEHYRGLGTPPEIRTLFREGKLVAARAQYRSHLLEAADDDLAAVAARARTMRTAMLCFEANPAECHRRIIAEELTASHGFTVVDLR